MSGFYANPDSRRKHKMGHFVIAPGASAGIFPRSVKQESDKRVNAELSKQALAKVGNPNVLVNLVSRRVRQLNSGVGAMSRPLVANAENLGAADIALREIIEEKIGWELPEALPLAESKPRRRKKS